MVCPYINVLDVDGWSCVPLQRLLSKCRHGSEGRRDNRLLHLQKGQKITHINNWDHIPYLIPHS